MNVKEEIKNIIAYIKKKENRFYVRTVGICVSVITAAAVFTFSIMPTTCDVTLNEDGKVTHITTAHGTVGDLMESYGIALAADDRISTDISENISEDMEIIVNRANCVTVISEGVQTSFNIVGGTVADALTAAGIVFSEYDIVSPALDTPITADTTITHTPVVVKYEYKKETIPYKTITKNNSSLEKGKTKVVQKGSKGLQKNTIQVLYDKNGVELSRTVIDSEILKQPKDKIVEVGTKAVYKATTGSTIKATITYYCACKKCCGKYSYVKDGVTYSKTASGKKIYNGMEDQHWCAATFGRLGDKIEINGTVYTIVDRFGSSSSRYKVDIFTPAGHAACNRLGKQRNVSVKLLGQ